MSIMLISLVFQALLIIHCLRTGRNQIWIWVLALLSFFGVIAYVAAEIVPELLRTQTAKRTVKGVRETIDPEADRRRFETRARVSAGVEGSQRLAEEALRLGRTREAMDAYRNALRGLYEHDPELLLGLAQAQFQAGEAAQARATLDELIRHNPAFRSQSGHLLYARALEAEGNPERALEEYRVLAGYFSGAEATVRHAQCLQAAGRTDEARQTLRALLDQAAAAPPHYRRNQEDWLRSAERALAEWR